MKTLITTLIIGAFTVSCVSRTLLLEEKIAILVSVSNYPEQLKLAPTTASSDMDSLKVALEAQGYTVYLLQDSLATKAGIQKVLTDNMVAVKGIGEFLFFLAGHGFRFDGKDFFIPYDGVPDSIQTNIYVDQLYADIKAYNASVTLMLTDICRNLPTRSAKQRIGPSPSTPVDTITIANQHSFLIKSAGPKQYAHEAHFGFGVFSYFFWKLLTERSFQQMADRNNNDTISMGELFQFLQTKTSRNVSIRNDKLSEQQPEWLLQGNPDVIFLYVPKTSNAFATNKDSVALLDCKYCPKHLGIELQPTPSSKNGVRAKDKKQRGLFTVNGITIALDIGHFIFSLKRYAIVIIDNPEMQWPRRLKKELVSAPELTPLVSPDGPFQIIHYPARTNSSVELKEILDNNHISPSEMAQIEPLFRKGTVISPGILVLTKVPKKGIDSFDEIHLVRYLPGYKKPRNLEHELSSVIAEYGTVQ